MREGVSEAAADCIDPARVDNQQDVGDDQSVAETVMKNHSPLPEFGDECHAQD